MKERGRIVAKWQIKNATIAYSLRKFSSNIYELKLDGGMFSKYRQIKADSTSDAIAKAERRVLKEVREDALLRRRNVDLVFANQAA